ncbi:hypothetical protein [Aureliella helgolandensis]|uniref:hypothetical protein n=1 Tax=Aureliella helgolandensis TaxID=2527968 RepID=UPI001E4F32A0|nr:hypothetical protein [Aureliella helgolandensis]
MQSQSWRRLREATRIPLEGVGWGGGRHPPHIMAVFAANAHSLSHKEAMERAPQY